MTRSKKPGDQFWQHVRNYLTVYLPRIRGLSPRTDASYRQSIAKYCAFLKEKSGIEFSRVSFEHVTRDSVVKFIRWLRDERSCGISTCNLRLSALKSFLKYCADTDIGLWTCPDFVDTLLRRRSPRRTFFVLSRRSVAQVRV